MPSGRRWLNTTPDHPAGRVLFAAVVATLAYHLQFGWQMRAGLFYALAASAPLVPLIDLALRSPRHRWRTLEA